WKAPFTVMPYHGSGYVPASFNDVCHGMLFCEPSQKRSRLGSVDAAEQPLVMMRSMELPPKTRAPRGRRALTFSSMPLYQRCRFGSVLSTFCTALAFAALTL